MKFSIHSDICVQFPSLVIGLAVVSGIDNRGAKEDLGKKIRDKAEEIRAEYTSETLSLDPNIQTWRRAYASFGAKPKKYKSSVESLYRSVLKGIDLKSINPIVDIYNFVSLKHKIPLGGDDLDKVDGGIELRFARGDERFIPLNSEETECPKAGEVIYADKKEVLCRRWNWRECDKTKMVPDTQNVALVLEGLPPVSRDDIGIAAEELGALIHKFCGGEIQFYLLDVNQREREMSFSPR